MKGVTKHFTRDEGMTLVEIVIAAAILFFIMTAILGLIGQTLSMGAQAKEMNVANNAVNSYVEWARSLPFAEIDTVSGSIETTVVVTGEYSITIEPSVDDGENEALKNLTLIVTVNRSDGFTDSFETMVVIRDRDQLLTEATRNPTTDPKVQFVSPTPPDGTVVWIDGGQSYWEDASGSLHALLFSVKVTPGDDRTIEMVTIQGEDSWNLLDSLKKPALWSSPAWTVSPAFSWDLAQTTTIGEPQVEEGSQDVWVWATDSASARGSDMRVYLVDNVEPDDIASAPTFARSTTSYGGTLNWPVTNDGNTFADHYYVKILRHDVYGTWTSPGWPAVVDGTVPQNSVELPATELPFSRYVAEVAAESPRSLQSALTPWMTFVTRPKITGTYTLSGNNKKWDTTSVTLSCGAPRFPTTGTIKYEWYLVSGTTETLIETKSTSSPTSAPPGPAVTIARTKDAVTNYPTTPLPGYRCKVTFTPYGMYDPGTMSLYSNTVYAEMPAGTAKAFTDGKW